MQRMQEPRQRAKWRYVFTTQSVAVAVSLAAEWVAEAEFAPQSGFLVPELWWDGAVAAVIIASAWTLARYKYRDREGDKIPASVNACALGSLVILTIQALVIVFG